MVKLKGDQALVYWRIWKKTPGIKSLMTPKGGRIRAQAVADKLRVGKGKKDRTKDNSR